ncbi:uncharacterized protein [Leuresthes tenuis]|uniref:uncharacterized protein n=1 Tax=Leuresthes tenuis TaxID=355514 RepID=UPI003B50CE10
MAQLLLKKLECKVSFCHVELMAPSFVSDPLSFSGFSALLQPNLTVNLPLITETDSVTLSCQPPSSVSVSQCFFYTVKGGSQKSSSCLQTLTAAELLRISHRTSPATVEVKCFYTVEKGDVNSPYSDVSYISIGQKPQLSVQQYEGDVSFVCSLPGSVKPDATCHLYFGEARRPVQTSTVRENRSSKANLWFCQFSLSVDDIIRRLVQQKDASCDYSLKYELNSLSPRSDPRSLADYVKGVSNSAVTMTTAKSTVRKLRFSTSTASVNLKPVSHSTQNTDTLTTVSTTAKSTVRKLRFSTSTASVNLKPVSHSTQNTDTLTTVSTTGRNYKTCQ